MRPARELCSPQGHYCGLGDRSSVIHHDTLGAVPLAVAPRGALGDL